MLRNILILFGLIIMLSGCLPDLSKYSTAEEPSKPVIDVNTGKVLNMWIPNEMRKIESWEYIARGEERMCSEGYYIGKYINKQHPAQRSTYKKYNDDGDRIWAYYYYYDHPASSIKIDTVNIKRMTVFNLYTDKNGKIYGCTWARYPGAYHIEHGTNDGLTP
ncbi:hypothetical protein [Desulfovibrio desulfuricans]|uniref:hypothetical protein n=1 Tax=Desulfovibrio desulfuricans TaxID=876 RepID=UPI001C00EFC7|nr:hypothetical protein [Desulfovibrio desulfuricans]MBT9749098.1 hypothetical protein [Desulfovibrio desulfuricans]